MLFGTVVANSIWDVGPLPEERLEQLGIDTTVSSMAAVLNDQSQPTEARYWSAIALGRTKDRSALRLLTNTLTDENADIRMGALVGLEELREPGAIPEISQLLKHDSNDGVRQQAIVSLMRIGGLAAEDALATAGADQNQSSEIRVGAVVALGTQSTATSLDKLRVLTESTSTEVRVRSIVILSRRYPAEYTPDLVEASKESELNQLVMDDVVNQLEEISGEEFTGGPIGWARLSPNQQQLVQQRIAEWWAGAQK